jgi:hypothetical protein
LDSAATNFLVRAEDLAGVFDAVNALQL